MSEHGYKVVQKNSSLKLMADKTAMSLPLQKKMLFMLFAWHYFASSTRSNLFCFCKII